MKERLEEIKAQLTRWQEEEKEKTFVEFWPLDMRRVEWLIEQAERAQDWKDTANGFYARVEQLKEQNNRYREAIDKITDVLATSRGNNEYATYKIRCILGRLYDSLERESE